MATLKYSRQREAIKQLLEHRRDHPTAEVIYEELREKDPKISLGTVYRNLALLTQLGDVVRITTGDGPDHFDGDTSRHYHFICRDCRRIIDLQLPGMQSVLDEARGLLAGDVEDAALYLTGRCEACLGKSGNRNQGTEKPEKF